MGSMTFQFHVVVFLFSSSVELGSENVCMSATNFRARVLTHLRCSISDVCVSGIYEDFSGGIFFA